MKIAVYGANGFQGKLTAPALMRRQIEPVLVGRNHARLSLAADELGLSAAKLSIANESDQNALLDAFDSCDAVINCAGPFTGHQSLLPCVMSAGSE